MKWIFAAVCLLVASTASGQSVYKCRDARGGLAYQSDPCPSAEKRWDVAPGARYGSYSPDDQMNAGEAERRVNRDRRTVQANNAPKYSGAVVGGSGGVRAVTSPSRAISGENRGSTCRLVRQAAADARKSAGHRLTFNGASALDQSVRNACK